MNRVWPAFTVAGAMIAHIDMLPLTFIAVVVNMACFGFTVMYASSITADMWTRLLLMAAVAMLLLGIAWNLDRSIRGGFLLIWEAELQKGNLQGLLSAAEAVVADQEVAKDIEERKQIFISYKHKDVKAAETIVTYLEAQGWSVWIDKEGIKAGADWRGAIADGIKHSVALIFLVTPDSVTSKYCKEEVYFASCCKKAIFPVVIVNPGEALTGGMQLILSRIQWTFADEEGQLAEALPKILEKIAQVGTSADSVAATRESLASFQNQHDSNRALSSRQGPKRQAGSRQSILLGSDQERQIFVTFPEEFRAYWIAMQAELKTWGFMLHLQKPRTSGVSHMDADAIVIDASSVVVLALYATKDAATSEAVHYAYEADIPIIPVKGEENLDISPAMEMILLNKPAVDVTSCTKECAARLIARALLSATLESVLEQAPQTIRKGAAARRGSVMRLSQQEGFDINDVSALSERPLVSTKDITTPDAAAQQRVQQAMHRPKGRSLSTSGLARFVKSRSDRQGSRRREQTFVKAVSEVKRATAAAAAGSKQRSPQSPVAKLSRRFSD